MKIEKITPQIAALYLGQKFTVDWPSRFIEETNITPKALDWLEEDGVIVTPHLRRLDSITEEEAIHIHDLIIGFPYGGIIPCKEWIHSAWSGESSFCIDVVGKPAAWLYLLSKGFDLFNLIDSGLAKEIPRS